MTSSNPGSVPDIPIPTYSLDFVAAGANRQANSSSWGQNGLVAYSASKFVGIYDPLVRVLSQKLQFGGVQEAPETQANILGFGPFILHFRVNNCLEHFQDIQTE